MTTSIYIILQLFITVFLEFRLYYNSNKYELSSLLFFLQSSCLSVHKIKTCGQVFLIHVFMQAIVPKYLAQSLIVFSRISSLPPFPLLRHILVFSCLAKECGLFFFWRKHPISFVSQSHPYVFIVFETLAERCWCFLFHEFHLVLYFWFFLFGAFYLVLSVQCLMFDLCCLVLSV